MELLGIGSRIRHAKFGAGVVTNVDQKQYWVTFIDNGLETIPLNDEIEVIEGVTDEVDTVSFFEVESTLRSLLKKWSDVSEVIPIADRWKGGNLILEPNDPNLANKEIPIETFFHKIVMLRDRLRVLEQKINSSGLDDQDKVDIQQYITRAYGSLTTFNILFKIKDHQFVGARSKK